MPKVDIIPLLPKSTGFGRKARKAMTRAVAEQPDSLGDDLREYLVSCAYDAPEGEKLQWVMNGEWWADCRRVTDASSRPLFEPAFRFDGPDYLLGVRVQVRDDGGVPHLEVID